MKDICDSCHKELEKEMLEDIHVGCTEYTSKCSKCGEKKKCHQMDDFDFNIANRILEQTKLEQKLEFKKKKTYWATHTRTKTEF